MPYMSPRATEQVVTPCRTSLLEVSHVANVRDLGFPVYSESILHVYVDFIPCDCDAGGKQQKDIKENGGRIISGQKLA